jgi:hypothetical protein
MHELINEYLEAMLLLKQQTPCGFAKLCFALVPPLNVHPDAIEENVRMAASMRGAVPKLAGHASTVATLLSCLSCPNRKQETSAETRRVAELLSQLPSEINVDELVTRSVFARQLAMSAAGEVCVAARSVPCEGLQTLAQHTPKIQVLHQFGDTQTQTSA